MYVDDVFIPAEVPNRARTVKAVWCHMTADTRAELDEMAVRIGLRRSWIQHPGTWKEHYDLTKSKRALAVKAGALEVSARDHEVSFLGPRRRLMQAAAPAGHDGPGSRT